MTRVFGVIGFPLSHSLSPVMHNAAFQALGLDAIYAPFEIPPAQFGRVLRGLAVCGIDGLNVTVPYKERVLRSMDRQRDVVAQASVIGAVNTLVRKGERFVGYNTDAEGFRRTLAEELHRDCRGKRVLLLGAGGAARAVGWALLAMRPRVIVVANRTAGKAKALTRLLARRSSSVAVNFVRFDRGVIADVLKETDILINATSLGLHPHDPLPVEPAALHHRLAVVDLVYRSPTTALVAAARRGGALAVDGLPMLVYQGAESFRLWWRRQPPIRVMRRAVEQALRTSSR